MQYIHEFLKAEGEKMEKNKRKTAVGRVEQFDSTKPG